METSDLGLSTHADISLLHKIYKGASQEKVSFTSIQASIKSMVKIKEISQLEKYLNFFMLVKSQLNEDSPLGWDNLFHLNIRRLERIVLAESTYLRSLLRKSLSAWRSQLNMKIIETYTAANQNRRTQQLVDPEIKVKARVFHCWLMYAQQRFQKKQHKSEVEHEMNRITQIHRANTIRVCLNVWREAQNDKKQVRARMLEVKQNIRYNKLREVLLLLREKKEIKGIKSAIHERVVNSLTKLRKHWVFTKLQTNLGSLQKPLTINSYYSILFLKLLLEKSYNNSKPIQYQNLQSLIKFKSKTRKQIFNEQLQVFYKILKVKSFRCWKQLLEQKRKLVETIKTMLRRDWLKAWRQQLQSGKMRKEKAQGLRRIVMKRKIKKLRQRVSETTIGRTQSKEKKRIASSEASAILKKTNLSRFVGGVEQLKQWRRKEKQVNEICGRYRVEHFMVYLSKNVKTNRVSQSIPSLIRERLSRKYFELWVRFYEERDLNMTEIYRFELNYTNKLKREYLRNWKRMGEEKEEELIQSGSLANLLKRSGLARWKSKVIGRKGLSVYNPQIDQVRKLIYFRRLSSQGKELIQKQRRHQKQYENISSRVLVRKVFKTLGQGVKQSHSKISIVMKRIEMYDRRKALKRWVQYWTENTSGKEVERVRHADSAALFFNKLTDTYRKVKTTLMKSYQLGQTLAKGRKQSTLQKMTESHDKSSNQAGKYGSLRRFLINKLLQRAKQNTIDLECFKQRTRRSEQALSKGISKRRLQIFKQKSIKYLQVCRCKKDCSDNLQQLEHTLQHRRKAELLQLLALYSKTAQLSLIISCSRKLKWKFFFTETRDEVKKAKHNDKMLQIFKANRQSGIRKTTIKSLLYQLKRRQGSLNAISSIIKAKCRSLLKSSMNSIFEEYRISFKLSACEKIRKRVAFERLMNQHMQIESTKLQQYKCIKHYAQNLTRKVFRGLDLCIHRVPVNNENAAVIVKTLPKVGYMR